MRIKLNRFLAMTAFLTSAAALLGACVSEQETTTDGGTSGTGGRATGGTGGATGGTGGATGGTGGTAGTGGAAGSGGDAGTAGAAGADAGPECLGDEGSAADAGGWTGLCDSLSYVGTNCTGDITDGEYLCDYMIGGTTQTDPHGRLGVRAELFDCLAAIDVADDCGTEHGDAVSACISNIFPQACTVSDATSACAEIAASCDGTGDAGDTSVITEETCNNVLHAFNDDARAQIVECYRCQLPATDICREDFDFCVFEVDSFWTTNFPACPNPDP